jgi:glycosyltransferase involved in cell wall biosynthesis
MPLISIITPSYSPVPDQLIQAYESLAEQDLPHEWEWEWVIQEDGNTHAAEEILPTDRRVKFGTGRRGGVAITRNLALARAGGVLIKNLDQDDVLTSGVLARDIEVLATQPQIGWTTSRVLDLLPDGSTVGFEHDPTAGPLRPGFVLDHWRRHNYRLPVHPTTVCIRRELAVALGGWMAVPGSDDTGLLIAASVITTGWFRDEVGLLYRKWPGQESASEGHVEPIEWSARMKLISERADALKALVATYSHLSTE